MSRTMPEWSYEVDRRQESLVALRRDFHRHPELSFEERYTAEIIAERLNAAGLGVLTGVALDGRPHPHHAPEFEMNEGGLPAGVTVGLSVMLDALRG